jgi:hypothetical protein
VLRAFCARFVLLHRLTPDPSAAPCLPVPLSQTPARTFFKCSTGCGRGAHRNCLEELGVKNLAKYCCYVCEKKKAKA